jgi:small subunit ribosomal protein S6
MFVVDSAVSAKDFNAVRSHIHRILEKVGAEIQASDRWDERKLAYEIKGVKRGTYILSYFLLDTSELNELDQQLQLSDMVVRHLIQQREKPIEPERRAPEDEEAEGGDRDRDRPRDRDRDRDRDRGRDRDRSYGARV